MLVNGCGQPTHVTDVRLKEVGPFTAKLTWATEQPVAMRVVYGEGELFDRELVEEQPTTDHLIKLTGLKPSTRYRYRLEPGGETASFRSAPGKDGAFDLVVLSTEAAACRADARALKTLPDVVVLAGPCDGEPARHAEAMLTLTLPEKQTISLRYGRWRLLLAADSEAVVQVLAEGEGGSERSIVVLGKLPEIIPAELANAVVTDGRQALYAGREVSWPEAQVGWLEVDAFEVAAVFDVEKQHQRQVIVEAPPETKKTCLYCDRLMESGRYEESLTWYRNFIQENQDRYAIEDAYYAIARILDEKLFAYERAITAYRDFVERYPRSRRVTLARHRLDYLQTYSDGDFAPLRSFEQAKAKMVRDNPLPTVAQVEALVEQYADAAIVEEALFWLGHLLETEDTRRAKKHYRALRQRFPDGENAVLAAIALGDIEYRAKHYHRAIVAYGEALQVAPETYHISINEKLRKSQRNVWRERIRYSAWGVLAVWLIVSVMVRVRPNRYDVWTAIIILAVFVLAAGLYFGLTYERTGDVLPVISVVLSLTSLIVLWNMALARALRKNMMVMTLAHGLTMPAAMLFLVFYQFHYLYLFGI